MHDQPHRHAALSPHLLLLLAWLLLLLLWLLLLGLLGLLLAGGRGGVLTWGRLIIQVHVCIVFQAWGNQRGRKSGGGGAHVLYGASFVQLRGRAPWHVGVISEGQASFGAGSV